MKGLHLLPSTYRNIQGSQEQDETKERTLQILKLLSCGSTPLNINYLFRKMEQVACYILGPSRPQSFGDICSLRDESEGRLWLDACLMLQRQSLFWIHWNLVNLRRFHRCMCFISFDWAEYRIQFPISEFMFELIRSQANNHEQAPFLTRRLF